MDEAWKLSPRALNLYIRGRHAAWFDNLKLHTIAANLPPKDLEKVMPRRPVREETGADEVARLDAWAASVNAKFEKAEAKKQPQPATPKVKHGR